MKRRIWVTHLPLRLSILAYVATGLAGQAQVPQDSEKARDMKVFNDRVHEYVMMEKKLEASLSTFKPTMDAAQIVEHQHALAKRIADARRDARQGDIFTHEVTEWFRKIIHRAFDGPEGRLARKTIQQDRPLKVPVLHVNDVVPEDIPITTTPPTLLHMLPELPPELTYRIVGHDLTLQDTKARLIVDLIPKVIR